MKKVLLIAILSLAAIGLSGQEQEFADLRLEARLDYMQEYQQGAKVNGASGFKGRFLNIRMDGNLGSGFSYSYRQRLNKPNQNVSFFDATDWIRLTYTKNNWSFTAGKLVLGIGGYEYDAAPIDLYVCSEYWSSLACYQVGLSASYTTTDKKDNFVFQFCESPFRRNEANVNNKEMFSYNALWYGSHGVFSSIWSVNMLEYLPGKFINYIALGNRFTFGDFELDLDIMNRAVSAKNFLGKDMSFMFNLHWSPVESLNIFAIYTHDFNNSGEIGDWCIIPGTDITRVGGGLEFFPIKNSKDLRFHLSYSYTDGVNTAVGGALQPEQSIIDAGVTWRMKLLKVKK